MTAEHYEKREFWQSLAAWLRPAFVLAWPSYLLVTAIIFVPMIPAFFSAFREDGMFTLMHISAFFTEPPNREIRGDELVTVNPNLELEPEERDRYLELHDKRERVRLMRCDMAMTGEDSQCRPSRHSLPT